MVEYNVFNVKVERKESGYYPYKAEVSLIKGESDMEWVEVYDSTPKGLAKRVLEVIPKNSLIKQGGRTTLIK